MTASPFRIVDAAGCCHGCTLDGALAQVDHVNQQLQDAPERAADAVLKELDTYDPLLRQRLIAAISDAIQ